MRYDKPEEVLMVERAIGRPLHPYDPSAAPPADWLSIEDDDDSITGYRHRLCYQLNDDQHIVGLNLAQCDISDGSFLSGLSSLTSLNVSDTSISDWSFLSGLSSLTSLNVSDNSISDGSFLSGLSSLTSLNVSDTSISDWSFLSGLSSLTSLNVSDNSISDGSFLSGLSSLTSLNVSDTSISDWSFLSGLSSLTSLNVRDTSISDWSFLSGLSSLTSLNVSYNSISDWSFLSGLSSLTSLNVRNTSISDWSFLSGLSSLTSLNVSYNRISDCSFLSGLSSLTSLNVSYNSISDWSFLSGLSSLTSLNVSDNSISDWSFLSGLSSLTSLNVSYNSISDWSFLSGLSSLTSLNVSDNRISDGSFLSGLSSLTTLDVTGNSLAKTHWVGRLTGLRSLSLDNNKITKLSPELIEAGIEIAKDTNHSLVPQLINIDNNPIETPAPEIVGQGHAAIVSWFAEIAAGKKRPLNEVKVILVGDGGAGKTSLLKRLTGQDADPHEDQTYGIDILDKRVKCGRTDILVHFWDFGGQVTMHATHQFFLTKRCLYVLVLDGRQEEDPEYWLKHIQTFGGDSPVLVVLNKMDQNPGFDVNRPFLTDKYPNIKDFFRVACLKERASGVPDLKKALKRELPKVELVREPWPETWFNVKTRLQQTNDHYMDIGRFRRICSEERVTDQTAQKTLTRYLNDLGIALHFDDPRLNLVQVLNPLWVTQAVYRIITSKELADGHGVLTLDQIAQILQPCEVEHFEYPEERRFYIIDLMKKDKFELCYELAPNRLILIPDLLQVEEPQFDFPEENILRFRFEYDFLPRSILPRFIVRRHTEIKCDDNKVPLQWRTGVVLSGPDDLDATAVVWSDNRDRKIMIEVAGRDRREYFRDVRREFGKIHDTFQKLDVSQKVPLPDEPAVAVDYEDLVFHLDEGVTQILVGEVRRKYDVRALLDGIERQQDRKSRRDSAGDRHTSPLAEQEFDVFLSHNSKDKPAVRELNERLQQRGINTWLDEDQLPPGQSTQDGLEQILATCGSAMVCVAENGFGPWHDEEMKILVNRRVAEKKAGRTFRIIPVRLPNAPDVDLPAFLSDLTWVDLRDGDLSVVSVDHRPGETGQSCCGHQETRTGSQYQ